jgi:uncharacterized membrane protein
MSGLWDMGIYDSIMNNMVTGKGFLLDFRGPFDHFSPILTLLVPFYYIFNSPVVLFAAQAVVISGAAFPLYYFAKRKLKRPDAALAIVLIYLMNPLMSRLMLFDFHAECVFPLLYFSAWLALDHKRPKLFLLLLFLCPFAKEDSILLIITSGLFLFTKKGMWKYGLVCLGVSVVFMLFVLKIWFPYISASDYIPAKAYPPLFEGGIVQTISNAFHIYSRSLSAQSFTILASVLLFFGLLPIFNIRAFMLIFYPVILANLCALWGHPNLLLAHYCTMTICAASIASVFGMRSIMTSRKLHGNWRMLPIKAACVMVIVFHIAFAKPVDAIICDYYPNYNWRQYISFMGVPVFRPSVLLYSRGAAFNDIAKIIPKSMTVSSQNNLGVFFIRHKAVYNLHKYDKSDIFIFDLKTARRSCDELKMYQERLQWVSNNPKYGCIVNNDGFLVYVKKALVQKRKKP